MDSLEVALVASAVTVKVIVDLGLSTPGIALEATGNSGSACGGELHVYQRAVLRS
ncbi:hypothetical protein CBOM_05281 [Ceraceosorus bombacis]|uniref:Uncharacterized protein n=1 Tax=Ceraceosorus bombacis TaxID=401625 RepID=A0A0P1BNU0_9BASI|nr:hypothetical protein CBOM_05281 [Ceraceosorus bombacis]